MFFFKGLFNTLDAQNVDFSPSNMKLKEIHPLSLFQLFIIIIIIIVIIIIIIIISVYSHRYRVDNRSNVIVHVPLRKLPYEYRQFRSWAFVYIFANVVLNYFFL